MEDSSSETMICDVCNADAVSDLNFCPNCGALYNEGVQCVKHPESPAIGTCVLCREAGCKDCCSRTGEVFLCNDHVGYEIMEGHALLYAIVDTLRSGIVADALTTAGLHPFVYTTTYNPGIDQVSQWMYTVYQRRSTLFKVFVPFAELGDAQQILDDLNVE